MTQQEFAFGLQAAFLAEIYWAEAHDRRVVRFLVSPTAFHLLADLWSIGGDHKAALAFRTAHIESHSGLDGLGVQAVLDSIIAPPRDE